MRKTSGEASTRSSRGWLVFTPELVYGVLEATKPRNASITGRADPDVAASLRVPRHPTDFVTVTTLQFFVPLTPLGASSISLPHSQQGAPLVVRDTARSAHKRDYARLTSVDSVSCFVVTNVINQQNEMSGAWINVGDIPPMRPTTPAVTAETQPITLSP